MAKSDTNSGQEREAQPYRATARYADRGGDSSADHTGPDVFLDVPTLGVEEIELEVDNLRAKVSLQAEVLDLVKLNVGADVSLGKVHLTIKGVEAVAQLEVRLDNVEQIIERVLTTIDRNPEILERIASGVGNTLEQVGSGARDAVSEIGGGTGKAVSDVGSGASDAVKDVGSGASDAVKDVGSATGSAVEDVGAQTAETARGATKAAKRTDKGTKSGSGGKTAKAANKSNKSARQSTSKAKKGESKSSK